MGAKGWNRKRCPCKGAAPGLPSTFRGTPAQCGASFAPSCQTRRRCPQLSEPQESKFPLENLHLRRTSVLFANPRPLRAACWRFGGSRLRRGPWRGGARSRAEQCSYLLPVGLQLPPRTAISLMQDGQERGVLRGFGADLLRHELRRAQSPNPAAGWLSPLILREKRKRLVGAATPGGVGRGRRGEGRPKDSWGSGARDQSRAPYSGPSHSASQEPCVGLN